jgi:hypothetical protein
MHKKKDGLFKIGRSKLPVQANNDSHITFTGSKLIGKNVGCLVMLLFFYDLLLIFYHLIIR